MNIIKTVTGSEWHTSHGAKGYVFVVGDDGAETHIHQSPHAKLVEQDWREVGRNHGKWCHSEYEIDDGVVVKLFAISTYRGRPNEGGGAYFVVDSTAPSVSASGGSYSGRGGMLLGSLRQIPFDELAERGIVIDPKQKKYYRSGIETTGGTKNED